MRKLQSFHRRVVRHVTGECMRKLGEAWEHPNHDELYDKAKLLTVERYVERHRGTLRLHFENNRPQLLK